MATLDEVLARFPDLDRLEVERWITRRWVRPDPIEGDGWVFEEIDIARVRLIHDLRVACDVPADVLPMMLSLIDQLYETRGRLDAVLHALAGQPAAVREVVREALTEETRGPAPRKGSGMAS